MCHTTRFHDLDHLTLNLFFDPPLPLENNTGLKQLAHNFFVFLKPLRTLKAKQIFGIEIEQTQVS